MRYYVSWKTPSGVTKVTRLGPYSTHEIASAVAAAVEAVLGQAVMVSKG